LTDATFSEEEHETSNRKFNKIVESIFTC